MPEQSTVHMEFHVSRQARDRYQFEDSLFALSGNVVFANLHGARIFAQRMNDRRDLVSFPEQAVRAGQINAMGLIDEILHLTIQQYREQKNPDAMAKALDWLYGHLGDVAVNDALYSFADEFPPLAVYRREVSLEDYIEGKTAGVPHRQILLEEMLMLWLANANPAFGPFRELFDDSDLVRETAYRHILTSLHDYFDTQPRFGPDQQNLIDMLRAPALAHPYSLSAQLEFVRQEWSSLLGSYFYRLLGGLDLIAEEEKAIFVGPGPALVYEYGELEFEPERFSPDLDWMPSLVLMAKNTYVWLDQLSRKHERPISRLDEIPDEELDALARWGFTGLWLIGLWERSPASRKVKQLCGNPEAVASAYSVYDYQIAADLGGEAAYNNLRERAWQRGIRMASDMVPNHVGIYSRWLVEHPDWFISLDHSPFPSYSFNGPDLSDDERVGIYLEDHYYDRSDAAVAFKRVDRLTGSEKYIYHGNDGTSMPWNDTAQLNYLDLEVREAVIQTILHVARLSPVIRFDAAMTLTKRHFQRLWFPEPGTGGAIPTRAEHSMTKAAFNAAMPVEFWREVVDRVAAEAPDTLLLAEAFWLMEGFFVRTLGMHRVYNSAFMNMLRDEDNAKYRSVMKNTLEFDPEILKRFVSFMNNPDEETTVAQFGKGDKYFGICTLLATLPGLPMFGHGQIEGLAEKYGMEYQRAYWDEQPDEYLIARHEREIFPLLHRRYLFAEVEDFALYDFASAEGWVNEDVFAYSNRSGDQRALVVYHNRFATAQGWVQTSAPYSIRASDSDDRVLVQKTLGEGLGLRPNEGLYYAFRDSTTGLEYIRNGQELCERGMFVALDAYKCHVFLDWREVQDDESRQLAHLAAYLDGRGVPSIEEALQEVFVQPVLTPFRKLVNAETFRQLMVARVTKPGGQIDPELLAEIERRILDLLGAIRAFNAVDGEQTTSASDTADTAVVALETDIARGIRSKLEAILQLPVLAARYSLPGSRKYKAAVEALGAQLDDDLAVWGTLFSWLFAHALGEVVDGAAPEALSRSWIDEWLLGKLVAVTLRDFSDRGLSDSGVALDEGAVQRVVGMVKILISHCLWFEAEGPQNRRAYQSLVSWLRDTEVQRFLQVNRYGGALWFNKEAFEQFLGWMLTVAVVEISAQPNGTNAKVAQGIVDCYDLLSELRQAADASEYQISGLLEAAQG